MNNRFHSRKLNINLKEQAAKPAPDTSFLVKGSNGVKSKMS